MNKLTRTGLMVAAALLPLPLMAQGLDGPVGQEPVQLAQAAPQSASLLDRPARLAVRDLALADALTELQARSTTPIVFSPSLLPEGLRVGCSCSERTVREALERLLDGLPLGYAEVGDYVVIERRAGDVRLPRPVVLASNNAAPLGQAMSTRPEAPATRTVRGVIVDRLTGLPLRGARVGLEPGDAETLTGTDGSFLLVDAMAPGTTVRVDRPGYHAARVTVAGGSGELEVALRGKVFSSEVGSIRGRVTDRTTGEPLEGVQIMLEGTSIGTTTRDNGQYLVVNVPNGTYAVIAQRIGYATARSENVRVPSGGTAEVDFAMRTQALSLEEVVVTGVTDPTSGLKVPFTVGKLTAEDMPVPAMATPMASIQGKIPGVHISAASGQPGSEIFVQLRSPTSMIRNNQPMYVVDGVILGSNVGSSSIDIDALDIESIEVIKGAAAAALYGSRAASGVISITTSRGAGVEQGTTRLRVRSEMGSSAVPSGVPLATSHFYQVNTAGQFLDDNGVVTDDPEARVIDVDRMMDNPYGGQLFDNVGEFYQPGLFMTNAASLSQNTAATNFLLSFTNYREKGTIATNDGYERNNFRANLDHRVNEAITLSSSVYHSRSHRDDLSGDPFWDLLMFPPDVDLGVRDEQGRYLQQPDPMLLRENPLWRQTSRDNFNDRARTLLSGQARVRPLSWLSFDGNLSYDRSDRTYTIYVPKGTPFVSSTDEDAQSDGRYDKEEHFNNALNASAGMNILWNFGALTTRSSLRALMEREEYTAIESDARDFWVEGVRNLGVAQRMFTEGYESEVRSNGYSWTLGLDYAGKYIGDLLLRRDGSSLFGPEARWRNYYRVSAAYRMAEEPWWPVEQIDEFKLRFSQGTSGGRPNFSDRYETWSVSSSGIVSKSTLGNRFLRPEHTTEREFGMDMILLDRFQLELTYATQETTDQIIQIPQPAVTGYSNQYQNSGTIEGHTYEGSLQANLVNTRDLQWSSTLIADRTRSEFTEWNRVCYVPGVGYTYRCQGMNHTQFYGESWVTSPSQLPEVHAGSASQFAINDDGYLVAVGTGSLDAPQWGDVVQIDGINYQWGHPILERDEAGNPVLGVIGEGFPDFMWGWQNQVRWKDLNFFSHVHAQVGGQVYNQTKQRLYQHYRHADLDQTGVAAERQKPIDYYQTLYEANNVNSHFVESAGFVKLRELSVRYTLGDRVMRGLRLDRAGTDRITLGLVGRNLFTISDYSGFDPEVTLGTSNSGFVRVDDFAWPNTRTITGMVEIQF